MIPPGGHAHRLDSRGATPPTAAYRGRGEEAGWWGLVAQLVIAVLATRVHHTTYPRERYKTYNGSVQCCGTGTVRI